jgi:predicted negative regulator of RcsB-dependent stress response
MPYRKRIQIKKELEPIQIETLFEKVLSTIAVRKTPLLILGGGILLFAIAFFSYTYFSGQSEKKAGDMEFAAYSEYAKKNRVSGAEQEKQIKLAIDLYQKLIAAYPKTKTASVASFYLGNAYVDIKDYDRGIESYKKALISLSIDEALRGVIHLRMGYAYLNKNEKELALKEFGEVEKSKLAQNQDFASYEIARIFEDQGKKTEALNQYESLVKNYPSSPLAADASAKAASIKGPASPAPAVSAAPGTSPSPKK